MQRYIRSMAIISAIVVAVGGVWLGKRVVAAQTADRAPAAPATTTPAAPAPRGVEVVRPERTAMSRSLNVPATIEAFEQADLYAKTAGYLSEVCVDIGDRVKQGDVLAVIDVPEMHKELAQAQAELAARTAALAAAKSRIAQAEKMLDMARTQLKRYEAELALRQAVAQRREELFGGQAITQEQLDEARNQLQIATADAAIAAAKIAAAEADVRSAEADEAVAAAEIDVAAANVARVETMLQYARITAPFDGVVTRRMVDRGDLVQSAVTNRTTPLFTVQRIDMLRVFIEVPETDIAGARPGCIAKVSPYGMLDKVIEGKIARTASSLNPATRTMRTEIDLSNADGSLLDGMYAHVSLPLDERPNALTIPAAALLTEGAQAYVYTVRDDAAVRTAVQIGIDDGVRVEVTQGLDDDALVVLAGKGLISAGAPVHAVLRGKPKGSS